MALYELWIENDFDAKYVGYYNRLPPEKNDSQFQTAKCESVMAAAQGLRAQLRKVMGADDQIRIKNRSSIYENINDALEDLLRL